MHLSMIFNGKSTYSFFTSSFKISFNLFSILSWKRFRIQLKKRGKRVRIHFTMNPDIQEEGYP